MKDLIIIIILVLVVGTALFYIIREKKKANKCIGCSLGGCKKCKECMDEKRTGH